MDKPIRTAILGASGYTGAELVRLLAGHPNVVITALTADRKAGQTLGSVFPHLAWLELPDLVTIDDVDWDEVDFVFCALPHGTTQDVIADLPGDKKIVDLSADFRLSDVSLYDDVYGHAHRAPALQEEAVYGLTEHAREAVAKARLVANPGCYPTSALLPLIPLVKAGMIDADDIIIDAKSGVSGAGRAPKETSLFTEVSEGIHAYGVGYHRHAPEIEQELGRAARRKIIVNFTPHLVPMNRGIFSTIYVRGVDGNGASEVRAKLAETYSGEPFVKVLPDGSIPQTRHVRGSNHCFMSVTVDRLKGRMIICSVEDNLIKGASGQAIQNMNVMYGLPESTGLTQAPMFP
ncbi:MAG: N-acetyl-gamma-glutamyl-phosphate reductase [Rhodospirillaceae bacterium]